METRALTPALALTLALEACAGQEVNGDAVEWIQESPFNVFIAVVVAIVWCAICTTLLCNTKRCREASNKKIQKMIEDDIERAQSSGNLEQEGSSKELSKAASFKERDRARKHRHHEKQKAARERKELERERRAEERRIREQRLESEDEEATTQHSAAPTPKPDKPERRGTAYALQLLEKAKARTGFGKKKKLTPEEIRDENLKKDMATELIRRKVLQRVQQKRNEDAARQAQRSFESPPPSSRGLRTQSPPSSKGSRTDTKRSQQRMSGSVKEVPMESPPRVQPATRELPAMSPGLLSGSGSSVRTPGGGATAGMTLTKLEQLRAEGMLDADEYKALKAKMDVERSA